MSLRMGVSEFRTLSPHLINYYPFAWLSIGNVLWRPELHFLFNIIWVIVHTAAFL